MKLKKVEEAFLQYSRVSRVATGDARGLPHVVPVCHLWEKGRVYFGTGRKTKKIRNLLENAQVALIVDDYTEAWSHLRGLVLQGRAEVIGPGAEFRRIRKLLYQKFPQYEEEAHLKSADAVMVRIVPTKVFSWGLGRQ